MFTQTLNFHENGSLPDPNSSVIFVFGSNKAGRHGKGAAQIAHKYFEAEYGVGLGLTGRAFAIPTKGYNLEILPLEEVQKYIQYFITYASMFPSTKFFVTAVGCGLARNKHEDIAPLFNPALPNCSYIKEWEPFLQLKLL